MEIMQKTIVKAKLQKEAVKTAPSGDKYSEYETWETLIDYLLLPNKGDEAIFYLNGEDRVFFIDKIYKEYYEDGTMSVLIQVY